MADPITVLSSHGSIKVDPTTGKPVWWNIDTEDRHAALSLLRIQRFDVAEWLDHHGEEKLDEHIDILDLGYFYRSESGEKCYEDPDAHARGIMKKNTTVIC